MFIRISYLYRFLHVTTFGLDPSSHPSPQLILRYASEIIEKNSIYQINQYCKLKKSSIKYHSNRHLNISVKKYIHVHEYLKFQCKDRAHFSFGTCISNKEVVSVLAGFRQTKVITSLRVH